MRGHYVCEFSKEREWTFVVPSIGSSGGADVPQSPTIEL